MEYTPQVNNRSLIKVMASNDELGDWLIMANQMIDLFSDSIQEVAETQNKKTEESKPPLGESV